MSTIWYNVARDTDADPTAIWAETWQSQWDAHYGSEEAMQNAERRLKAHPLFKIFCTEFCEDAKVLEGGCGLAFWVKLLRNEGRDVVGLDFDFRTVERLNDTFPDLPVLQGDVTDLPFEAASFDGYISLGVVEHFVDGPQRPLREAWRILKPNGVLVLSVPYLNPVRQVIRPFTAFSRYRQGRNTRYKFYQYLYSRGEIERYLRESGFRVRGFYPSAPHVFLTRFPLFLALFNVFYRMLRGKKMSIGKLNIKNRSQVTTMTPRPERAGLEQLLRQANDMRWLRVLCGHEAVFICDKNEIF